MDKLIDIILQHKNEFRLYYPIHAFDDLLTLREKEDMRPTPKGFQRLTEETIDLVIKNSELPQYLTFMNVFHSDVIADLPSEIRQQFLALTKHFLLQFPRGAYVGIAKNNPTNENQSLMKQYESEFNLSLKSLKDFAFSKNDIKVWMQTMLALHHQYDKVVEEAQPYTQCLKNKFKNGPGYPYMEIAKAVKDGFFSLDKEKYNKENIIGHRYFKSVNYFMHEIYLYNAYGPDFIGPFGIFYPISEKCGELCTEFRKSLWDI